MSERETTPLPIGDVGVLGLAPGPLLGGPPLVVLFGGTFDPPHRGHVELPVQVRDELERRGDCVGLAWLVYVPAARSPHKERGPAASDADRMAMLGRGLEGVPRAGVWMEEIDRARGGEGGEEHGRDARATEPSYTVETVRRAREWLDAHGMAQTKLRLLIGADQALSFHRWREPREILRLARPAVLVRGEVADAEDLVGKMRGRYWSREDLDKWRECMVVVERMDVSATRVRGALRDGDVAEVERWLAPGVAAYIRERGLYG